MSDSLIPSFLVSDVSESLRSLTKNEQPWAICSGHSPKISNHEQIAQVAHQKWANEQITCFFERIAHLLIFLQKTSDSLRKPMSEFPTLLKCVFSRPFPQQNLLFPCFASSPFASAFILCAFFAFMSFSAFSKRPSRQMHEDVKTRKRWRLSSSVLVHLHYLLLVLPLA